MDPSVYRNRGRFRRNRVYGGTLEISGGERIMKKIRFVLFIFFTLIFANCSTPPDEPIFDYKFEVQNLKENNSRRKKSADPVEIEQICNDNEEGRRRALDAFIREKSFGVYWKKIAESRKADAEFGRSVKRWFFVIFIGCLISIFGCVFLYVSGLGSKVIDGLGKLFTLIPGFLAK
ncbi:hypothetical protein [Leptospira ellisii]|uniref:hypothetical protein n=1 Tax=Leptospira ellisii TaxID=2023197 RepID=UPI001FAF4D3E|nr:hypothetical protein [Leptospira ellisii]